MKSKRKIKKKRFTQSIQTQYSLESIERTRFPFVCNADIDIWRLTNQHKPPHRLKYLLSSNKRVCAMRINAICNFDRSAFITIEYT